MPFETVAIDFITKLPLSQGYDSIPTVTDHDCTKAAIFIPCNEEINAEEMALLYLKQVVTNFGLPNKIISNRDPQFASKFTQELCRLMGIKQNISTAYHPRKDGQSERTNQWVEMFLQFITNHKQNDWACWLPMVQFAHNNWPSDTTRKSPFFLLMGYNPRADWKNATSPLPQVTLHVDQFKEAWAQAQSLMVKAQKSWVKHKDTPKYKEGNLVWLEGKNLHTAQPTPKLAARHHGPFKVIQVMSPINYHLELPLQWSIHPVFHIDLLTPYRETITHGANYQRPPPDLVDNTEEYEVEKILDSRLFSRRQRLQYLVKWKGYPDLDNMWFDKDDVFADDKVQAFKESNPDSRTHLRAAHIENTPHSPLASSRSSSTSYFTPHILSMSSNESHVSSTVLHLDLLLPSQDNPTFPIQTPSSPPRLLTPSGDSHCILQPSSAENHPRLSLKFLSPMPKSLGMWTARKWHREQLLQAHLRMEQRNASRIKKGQIPMTLTTSLTCDHAPEDAVLGITAMDTLLHCDPDSPQHPYPFRPGHYPSMSL